MNPLVATESILFQQYEVLRKENLALKERESQLVAGLGSFTATQTKLEGEIARYEKLNDDLTTEVARLETLLEALRLENVNLIARLAAVEQQVRDAGELMLLGQLGYTVVTRVLQFIFGDTWKRVKYEFRISTLKDVNARFASKAIPEGDAYDKWEEAKEKFEIHDEDVAAIAKKATSARLTAAHPNIDPATGGPATRETFIRIITSVYPEGEFARDDCLKLLDVVEKLSTATGHPLVDPVVVKA